MASRERRGALIEEDLEEEEVTLDASNETGLRKLQVHVWLLFEDSTSSLAAKVVQAVLIVLILVSTLNMLVESHTDCHYDSATYARVCEEVTWDDEQVANMGYIEAACIASFSIEFLSRMFASPATIGLRAFVTSPMNAVDLMAIIPFYLETILMSMSSGEDQDLGPFAVLRVIRLTRVVRVLKVSKSMRGPVILWRTISKSAVPFLMLVSFVVVLAILCSSLMLSAEKGVYVDVHENVSYHNYYGVDGSVSAFASFWFVAWWCVQTLTSEGYGDEYVITDVGKVVATITAVCGMFLLALPITIIGANFDEEYERSQRAAALDKKSRVVKYNIASRNGTRPVRPVRRIALREALFSKKGMGSVKRITPHHMTHHMTVNDLDGGGDLVTSSGGGGDDGAVVDEDEKFGDQAYNVQADISMLLDGHFEQLREKFDGMLMRHTDNLNRWVTTDLHHLDAECKAARTELQVVGRLKGLGGLGSTPTKTPAADD